MGCLRMPGGRGGESRLASCVQGDSPERVGGAALGVESTPALRFFYRDTGFRARSTPFALIRVNRKAITINEPCFQG